MARGMEKGEILIDLDFETRNIVLWVQSGDRNCKLH